MNRSSDSVRDDFDAIARLSDAAWDHNAHYHRFLLGHLPPRIASALDAGCGSGAFTRLLAERAGSAVGIDLSPGMIAEARRRSAGLPNVTYCEADLLEWGESGESYDCIASIATLHHLPMEESLQKLSRLLRPGGTLLVLDLRRNDGVGDLLLGMIAFPFALALSLLRTGRLRPTPDVRRAWAEHARGDRYPTPAEVRAICSALLPGARIRRHLLWRYSIVWRSPG